MGNTTITWISQRTNETQSSSLGSPASIVSVSDRELSGGLLQLRRGCPGLGEATISHTRARIRTPHAAPHLLANMSQKRIRHLPRNGRKSPWYVKYKN